MDLVLTFVYLNLQIHGGGGEGSTVLFYLCWLFIDQFSFMDTSYDSGFWKTGSVLQYMTYKHTERLVDKAGLIFSDLC